MKLLKISPTVGLTLSALSMAKAQEPAMTYYQYDFNHSHIIGIPAMILRYKQWREQKQLMDLEIERQQLLNQQLRMQIEREARNGSSPATRKAAISTAKN